jgi:hypothetical protein
MNVNLAISQDSARIPMPAFLKAIARPVSLLPGEDPEELQALRDIIIHDIAPQSGIEWLWTIDLIELSWDIQRYRTLRHKVLETHRQRAIEQALRRIDCAGIPSASQEIAYGHVQRNAAQWHDDPQAAVEVEARLASHGFDARSIDMEVNGAIGPNDIGPLVGATSDDRAANGLRSTSVNDKEGAAR